MIPPVASYKPSSRETVCFIKSINFCSIDNEKDINRPSMVQPSFHCIMDKTAIDSPEGLWSFVSERRPAALTFNPDLVTKLVVAEVGSVVSGTGSPENTFILWNAHTALFIYPASMSDRVSDLKINTNQMNPA